MVESGLHHSALGTPSRANRASGASRCDRLWREIVMRMRRSLIRMTDGHRRFLGFAERSVQADLHVPRAALRRRL